MINRCLGSLRLARFYLKQAGDPLAKRLGMRPELVIFDLYGTLIQFGVKLHPYRRILQWAREQGRSPRPDDARGLMTLSGDPIDVFSSMGIFPPEYLITQLHADIEQELSSLKLFEDVVPTLNQLSIWNIPMAVCSNLASPYGAVLERLLPGVPFLRCLSYEVGYIKPEPEIYQWIVNRAAINPARCLFVGDTLLADYEGPRTFGFNARHLIRGAKQENEIIGALSDLFN